MSDVKIPVVLPLATEKPITGTTPRTMSPVYKRLLGQLALPVVIIVGLLGLLAISLLMLIR